MNRKKKELLAFPYIIWMAGFTIIPLLMIFCYGLTDRSGSFTLENIMAIASPEHAKALALSLVLAAVSTLICLILAYPLALILRSRHIGQGSFIVFVFILPMWMNFLLRTMAWQTLLEKNGVINSILSFFHLPQLSIINTPAAIILGMVYNFLPFMVLPIYTVLKKLDHRVIEAAEDLGANPVRVFFRVTLPLSMPGVVSGVTMVFMPAATTFAISRLLGSGMFWLMGDLIDYQFREISMASGQNFGSALSLIMMVLIILSIGLLRWFDPKGEGGGMW